MALILENRLLLPTIFELTLGGLAPGRAGQFLQLHLPDASMLLPRPVSLFDADAGKGETRLVYRVVGRGTRLLSTLRGGELRVTGPLGNGFPLLPGDATLIGGGLGIAPLRLLCKALRQAEPARRIRVYLGYSDRVFLADAFVEADEVITDVGGYITNRVPFSEGVTHYACGPEPMMRAAAKKARALARPLYVSLERRMACGVGACYACSVATRQGNKRVCKDGPVFLSEDVYDGA